MKEIYGTDLENQKVYMIMRKLCNFNNPGLSFSKTGMLR